jgi:DNA polymerase-3 subunit delta
VKATQRDFGSVAQRAARSARIFFLCGPDEAGIHDAARLLIGLLDKPGERIELSGAAVRADEALLADEARSNSLFGETRHIVVRANGDEVEKAVEALLAGEVAPCPVVIMAAGATDKSRTAKLLADRPDALVAMFWPPDLKSAAANVRMLGDRAGVTIDHALAERIARATGLDSRLAAAEVEKLALFLDASPERPDRSRAADAFERIGASTEDDGFAPLVNAVLGGEVQRIAQELQRVRQLGLNPVGVLLALERRVAQLAQLAGRKGTRTDLSAFLKAERVFFKEERDIAVQLSVWNPKRLERLVKRLVQIHSALLANSQDAELLLLHGLADVGREGSRRRSDR